MPPFFQFLVRPPYRKFLFSELWRWARDCRFMTNWASTTHPPNCHPCTFSCIQLWFHRRDVSSVPLEDPDRGTDKAAICYGKCTQCSSVHTWKRSDECSCSSNNFHAFSRQPPPPPPEQRIPPTGPPPNQTNLPQGSSWRQLAGLNARAFVRGNDNETTIHLK